MNKSLGLILFIIVSTLGFGQNKKSEESKALKLFEQAKQAFDSNSFGKSLELLNDVIEIEPGFVDAYLMKSDIYQELDSVTQLINSLEMALHISPDKYPKSYFILGNAYYKSGFYQQASDCYQNYLQRVDENATFVTRARQNIKKCSGAVNILKHPVTYNAINLGENINSVDDEYWPSITVDGKTIIFTRLVGSNTPAAKRKAMVQEDFFTSNLVNQIWQPSEPISTINTEYNEGAQTISSDGKLLFFTACTRSDGWGSCDIYFSRNKGGNWSNPQNAGEPINSMAWESQPSITANGETLFFVSNRKGGKGGMDIWKCTLKGFSEWGRPVWGYPVNLGDSVNTPGNEMSPFIHSDGKTLYFASDYWPGMGGYDIFYCHQKNDSVWSHPQNIGYPINSHKDEQGLVVDASGLNAYYSSDRPGSRGMDIYSFELYKEARPTPVSYIKGKVVDEDSGLPVCAKVELIDLDNTASVIKGESCWEKGEFLMCLPLGKEYAFNISTEGYLFYSDNFKLKEVADIIDPYILEIKMKKIKIGGSVVLRNIFFNTGSYELLSVSKVELQKLIDFLNLNKSLIIEISGHTDNVGTADLNQKLSEDRAKEVYKYLVNHEIDQTRMKYIGYGFEQPISSNNSPEGRALNRRTEFRIIKK
jgi:outer membrane protein OmpA-like peptidoglycan-associated protein/tetratricopeptide (TPR) repeat protein